MFKNLKLRWKILLCLVGLSIIPLVLTLVLMSGFTGDIINRDMLLMASKTSDYVEQSTQTAKQELTNYVALISSGADMVNATYYAALTGDVDQQHDAQLLEALRRLQPQRVMHSNAQ